MLALAEFTADDLTGATGITSYGAHSLIRRLSADGVVCQVDDAGRPGRGSDARRDDGTFKPVAYQVVRRTGAMPRAVDEKHFWQCQAWRTMNVHRRFTPAEIHRCMQADSVSLRALSRWCKALAGAGYLRQHGPSTPGQENVYQMVRYDGPEPPMIVACRAQAEAWNEC